MLQAEHSAILLTFIKLPFVNKIFVLSIFEWLFYTGFSVCVHIELIRLTLVEHTKTYTKCISVMP